MRYKIGMLVLGVLFSIQRANARLAVAMMVWMGGGK